MFFIKKSTGKGRNCRCILCNLPANRSYPDRHTFPFLPPSFFANDLLEQYNNAITTGAVEGMYRPCAFFLEPAQYSQYCTIGLGSCLFTHRPKTKNALFISLGIFASTSGMGFVSVFAIWGAWALSRQKLRKTLSGVYL